MLILALVLHHHLPTPPLPPKMSFFGFNTTLPRDRAPPIETRGIFDTPDPFAEVARARAEGYQGGEDDDV